eukprot:CAMPEP_0202860654 /NCGR_PEP_ID=MMETSP1391-20130828/2291_1 /ASSEMBLY_ACC=CAM_ASM_000867 /TAXON_ID=1034604 /ORGANISM="Chlamydomonas leiostraca, Strain SAG 11-49" /LENGTH=76 /DNA_ID=CAMNT_0049539867 /DNA_START=181 /DNA_END=411 /DNA_ORIENTATION=-
MPIMASTSSGQGQWTLPVDVSKTCCTAAAWSWAALKLSAGVLVHAAMCLVTVAWVRYMASPGGEQHAREHRLTGVD